MLLPSTRWFFSEKIVLLVERARHLFFGLGGLLGLFVLPPSLLFGLLLEHFLQKLVIKVRVSPFLVSKIVSHGGIVLGCNATRGAKVSCTVFIQKGSLSKTGPEDTSFSRTSTTFSSSFSSNCTMK